MKTENNHLIATVAAYDRIRIQSDGDGVRTLVCFYGCPLRCKYCINPQTWDGTRAPKLYTVKGLLSEVEIDSLYFQATNGGITFGGGEPLLQADFIESFIRQAPKGWNFWVETSLAAPFENIAKIAPLIAKFVVDIKSLDEEIYEKYTGRSLSLAKENLKSLISLVGAKKIWVRVPYIPEFTTREQQNQTVAKLKKLGVKHIEKFDYTTSF